jgi:hypothetical protein
MSSEWYLARGGQQRMGPLTSQQLKQMAAAGQVTGNDLVWKEGMAQWVPASQVKGLLGGSGSSQSWQSDAVAAAPASAPAAVAEPAAPVAYDEDAAVRVRTGGEPSYYGNLENFTKPYLWIGLACAVLMFLYGAYATLSLFSIASGMGYFWVGIAFLLVVLMTILFAIGIFLAVWLIHLAVDMGRSLRSIDRKSDKS